MQCEQGDTAYGERGKATVGRKSCKMQHIAREKEEEKTPNLFGTRTNRPDSPSHTVDMTNRSLFSAKPRIAKVDFWRTYSQKRFIVLPTFGSRTAEVE